MKNSEFVKQSWRQGQQQTRWHKWFLTALVPLSFAYCAVFPFSSEIGPSTIQLFGFLPLVVGALLWADFKGGSKIISIISSRLSAKTAPTEIDLQDLESRIDFLGKSNNSHLVRITRGRQQCTRIRTDYIKWRSVLKKRGDASGVHQIDQLQEEVTNILKQWIELEKEVLSSAQEIRLMKVEINNQVATLRVIQAVERMAKNMDERANKAEKEQRIIQDSYQDLQRRRIASA
ncbi:hypothetical protein B1R32_105141 [Abditibacterium utsteinense]|uniref:Uncharacterized protein n=1 Tax=Abditibacterium utsteinense TaxID=1960156 RepID=A0A2S8SUM1_9BACT|nr:hypothetical protein [Abditibacterium utsteinense]PQV64459.1 hypothetical protein B1R32_105141 [Abditibacterium utsteinense]